jgi:hypothetical protein
MKNWKSILLLGLVFFAGVAVGVVGTRVVIRRVVQQTLAHPERAQFLLERNLKHKLRLDTDQQVQVHAILTDARGQLRDLRQELQPRAGAVLRATNDKISALLTPEQLARFDQLKAEERPLARLLRSEP